MSIDSFYLTDCGELTNPANGSVSYANTTKDAVANYTCNEGFYLNGSEARVCQSNGFWSDVKPMCFRKS